VAHSRLAALSLAIVAVSGACSASPQSRTLDPTPVSASPSVLSPAETTIGVPLATSTPIPQCADATTEALVRRFVAEFNAGAIDKAEGLFAPSGDGFRFLSTQKGGVEYDRTRVAPILQDFYQTGERMNDIRFIAFQGAAGFDAIGGTAIRYGIDGGIKFQIYCKSQLIAAIAWDGVEQSALRR
jgi:hypothetical protein